MQLVVMDSSTEMQEVRGQNGGDKEQDAHEKYRPCPYKHLGQRDEHQAGACAHARYRRTHGRNDPWHRPAESHAGIEDLDLIHRFVQVYLRFDEP